MVDRLPGIRQLARWRALPRDERPLFLLLLAILPSVAVGLRLLGLATTRNALAALSPRSRHTPARSLDDARALGRTIDLAARHAPGRPTCLTKSLTLWWLLQRRGIDSTLRLGVRTDQSGLRAHAWVEVNGQVINDTEDVARRFVPFEDVKRRVSWSGA